MKVLFCLFAMLMLNKECDQNKTADSAVETNNSNKIPEDISFSYEATSRGFYEKVWVSKLTTVMTNDRDQKNSKTEETSEKDWNELMALLKEIDIKSLPELEDPTQMRFYDGAAIATFAVQQDKQEIKTEAFDHGHPPIAIEALVNKVLSMNQLSKKQ